jgi:hypothetical protein
MGVIKFSCYKVNVNKKYSWQGLTMIWIIRVWSDKGDENYIE